VKVYFGGAEKGTYRNILKDLDVKRFAMNLTHLPIPKKKELDLPTMFNGGEILVYISEGDEDLARYDSFIRDNADQLDIIIGHPTYDGAWLGEKYVPIWNDENDVERLAWLCQKNGRVAISDKAINNKNQSRIRQLSERWGTKLIGITSKPDLIEGIPWESVVVVSWTSVLRYGETQVWDGHGLRRYPAQQKDSARRKHRADIMRLGIDYDAVIEDEVAVVGALAVESWKQWETRTFGGYDPVTDDDEHEFIDPETGVVIAISPPTPTSPNVAPRGSSIAINAPEKRHENERLLLPVMGIENVVSIGSQTYDNEGESIEIAPESTPVIKYNANPLRQCDNCYLSSRCPSFKEHSECAFSLPIEIRTKDQLQAAMRAIMEMQVGRVMFARFAEELEGQGLDPALSQEMDRLFNLVDKFKNISDTRDTVRFEVEARGSSGVLSRLFGNKAGEQARMLPGGGMGPDATNAMYAEIIDLSEET
jgi:hypothetical protein